MKRLLILFLLAAPLPASADIYHTISKSTALKVNAPATQTTRLGTSYSVSGSGVDTSYTPSGGSAVSDGLGSLTIASGVGSIPSLEVTQKTAGNSFSFSQNFFQGDAVSTSAPTVGTVGNFSEQTSTLAGSAGSLAGTITDTAITLTAGGAGSEAVGQIINEIVVK